MALLNHIRKCWCSVFRRRGKQKGIVTSQQTHELEIILPRVSLMCPRTDVPTDRCAHVWKTNGPTDRCAHIPVCVCVFVSVCMCVCLSVRVCVFVRVCAFVLCVSVFVLCECVSPWAHWSVGT